MNNDNRSNSSGARPPGPRSAPPSPWAITLGTVAGIPIRLHMTFLLFLAFLALVIYRGPDSGVGLLFLIGVFGCVLLHELGHSLVARKYGIPVSEIVLYPIGGVARMEKIPKPHEELWIALAGPAVNLVIAIAILIGLIATGSMGTLGSWTSMRVGDGFWIQELMIANLMLAFFNLIPAFPMDGGRILRAILALIIGEVPATRIAVAVGQFMAFVMGFIGLVVPSVILIFIAFFVFIGASQEGTYYQSRALVQGLSARAAMLTDFRTLPIGATLQDATNLLLETSQQDFPVIYGEEVVGVLSRQSLLRGLSTEGPSGYVTGSMQRDFITASPDADLQELASNLQAGQQTCALIMENEKLVGMLTMENLAEFLIIQQIMQRQQGQPT